MEERRKRERATAATAEVVEEVKVPVKKAATAKSVKFAEELV